VRSGLDPRKGAMNVEARITIHGSRAATWAAITDIANAPKTIRGIRNIQVLEEPASGLVGLRWRETRLLFGKEASVDKWITDAAENEHYETRAESDGFVFLSTMSITESGDGVTLTSAHVSRPQTLVARLMSLPMFLFRGVTRRALLQDLSDIKSAVERH